MDSQFHQMTLGDIFEKTISLAGKTFVRNLFIALTFLVVPAIMVSASAGRLYEAIAGSPGVSASFSVLATYFGATLIMLLAVLLAEIAISYTVWKEILGEHVDFKEALRDTFDGKWISGLGQAFLKYGAVFGGIVGIGAVFVFLDTKTGGTSMITKGLLMLFQVPFFLLAVPAVIFLFYRWLFSLTAVAVEGLDSVDALRKSWRLVKGFWWRTFWIFFLLSLLSEVAVSIISLPLKFGSMWGVYAKYFSAVSGAGGRIAPEAAHNLRGSLWAGAGIGTTITSILSLLITPVFTVVMYFDLKARHNDFPPQQLPEANGNHA